MSRAYWKRQGDSLNVFPLCLVKTRWWECGNDVDKYILSGLDKAEDSIQSNTWVQHEH